MKAIIQEVLNAKLQGLTYQSEHTSTWTKDIADEIRDKLKGRSRSRWFSQHARGLDAGGWLWLAGVAA